jgi:probable rRNA maturation factor
MAERGQVTVEDRQGAVALGENVVGMLARVGTRALGLLDRRGLSLAGRIDGAAIFLVDDREIGVVHAEFFHDPDPTDVITFPLGNYGEVLISVETARRQAGEYGAPMERELALYVVHGLLHLCGYEDETAVGRDRMATLQEAIVSEVY